MKEYEIRNERVEEQREVENLIRESFWNVYRPGCLEHYVMHCLRKDPAFIPELNFVMTAEGKLIGQCMCMRAVIKADDGRVIPIMTLGPIGIHPDCQRQGYGKALLDHTSTDCLRARMPRSFFVRSCVKAISMTSRENMPPRRAILLNPWNVRSLTTSSHRKRRKECPANYGELLRFALNHEIPDHTHPRGFAALHP